MKTLPLLFAFAFSFSCYSQIGAKAQQASKIYGLWQNNKFGYQMTLMLNADGSGEFDGETIRFTAQANQLSITQSGQTTVYSYTLQGSSLTLSGGDIEGSIVFTRSGAEPPGPNAAEAKVENPQSISNSPNDLLGAWSGNGETIEFKTNGQCLYLGNTFPYEVSQGHVTLSTQQGMVMFAYKVSGSQLTLMSNGREVVYSKGSAPASNTSATGGTIAQELVGKWCYINVTSTNTGGSSTDECITLKADGTYEYYSERSMSVNTNAFAGGTSSQNSDRGTWWVQGDRIHYNSATRGQGSYQLQKVNHPKNGDPMIVLDGTSFVTFYQKAPWR